MVILGGGLGLRRLAVVVAVVADAVGVKAAGVIQPQGCGVELVLVGVVAVGEVVSMLLKLKWLAVAVKAVPSAWMAGLKTPEATAYSMLKNTQPAVDFAVAVVFVVCL